jgi:hypothetical protein
MNEDADIYAINDLKHTAKLICAPVFLTNLITYLMLA